MRPETEIEAVHWAELEAARHTPELPQLDLDPVRL